MIIRYKILRNWNNMLIKRLIYKYIIVNLLKTQQLGELNMHIIENYHLQMILSMKIFTN